MFGLPPPSLTSFELSKLKHGKASEKEEQKVFFLLNPCSSLHTNSTISTLYSSDDEDGEVFFEQKKTHSLQGNENRENIDLREPFLLNTDFREYRVKGAVGFGFLWICVFFAGV